MKNFDFLVNSIAQTHEGFQQQAAKAVNINLTLRNWLIGFYIVEFEQNGEDRAKYGENLIQNLASHIDQPSLSFRNLKLFRQFYSAYPQIRHAVAGQLVNSGFLSSSPIMQTVSAQLQLAEKQNVPIGQTLSAQLELAENGDLANPNVPNVAYYKNLIQRVSFSNFVELLKIENSTKRRFYELLILKTTPSIRELQRQINTLAYERMGMSHDNDKAFEQLSQKIEPESAVDAVKSIYLFDFMGLKSEQLIEERELETALLNHVQEFILELGHGFCFEARQQRILIDEEYYFADLVFYHRILKCHILIELKIDAFKHEYLSQLNTYVAYYREEIKRTDDNPPIGILLCTEKGTKLVEYALSGMDEQLFVSKYLVELPNKEQLEAFIIKEMRKWKH